MVTITEAPELVKDVPVGLELGLRNYWYPILWSESVPADKPVGITVLGEDLVVWRDQNGEPSVLVNRCAHRAAKLSIGRVLNGNLQCIYHGLRYNGAGECTLIPWAPDDSPLREDVHVQSYPARELGGYIWAYIGDTTAFPPPPLEDEVPEELLHPDEFVVFRIPNDIWYCNWLIAIDGSDGFHAVILHAETQAVADKEWKGGAVERPTVPLADRRVKVVEASYGIRALSVDLNGNPIHQGHMFDVKGEKFVLPSINATPLVPVPGVPPIVSRLFQFPAAARSTHVVRYEVCRCRTPDEREQWAKLFQDVVGPRISAIGPEDKMVAESQGDLVDARSREYLFEPDMDMYKVRTMFRDAFLEQLEGRRVAPTKESLVYPIGE